jgi:hypothetical protein
LQFSIFNSDLTSSVKRDVSNLGKPSMPLRDPVVIYNAASNPEAILVRDGLIAAEIEAFVVEDLSQAGVWMGGLTGIHKPQVWVDRADVARAAPVLLAFEQRAAERRDGSAAGAAPQFPIEVVCEECDARASFPASMRGSVQECPECGAYIDVEADEPTEPWTDDEKVL